MASYQVDDKYTERPSRELGGADGLLVETLRQLLEVSPYLQREAGLDLSGAFRVFPEYAEGPIFSSLRNIAVIVVGIPKSFKAFFFVEGYLAPCITRLQKSPSRQEPEGFYPRSRPTSVWSVQSPLGHVKVLEALKKQ